MNQIDEQKFFCHRLHSGSEGRCQCAARHRRIRQSLALRTNLILTVQWRRLQDKPTVCPEKRVRALLGAVRAGFFESCSMHARVSGRGEQVKKRCVPFFPRERSFEQACYDRPSSGIMSPIARSPATCRRRSRCRQSPGVRRTGYGYM